MNAVPRAAAPALDAGLHWVNSDPVQLSSLRGRVVVLWFWHASSAWCHNVLDDLRALQARHGAGLSVIGIHVPKFEAERDPRSVLKAVNRLGIRFPVAADPDFVAWQHYGLAGWPSTLLLDASGAVRKVLVGDMRRPELEQAAAELLQEAARERGPAALPEPFRAVQNPEPRLAMAFPSGLAASASHLYVCDSAHHRVLECTHEGQVLRQFGTGTPGLLDGTGDQASFQSPRGLALWNDALYVADTGNHALRRIRLVHGEVETLLGNGTAGALEQGADQPVARAALNAPWDVAAAPDRLYIAMAGAQQVWTYHLGSNELRALAGSGELGVVDGVGSHARLAQPAALALVQRALYVADLAGSAVRCVHLGDASVQTLVGRDLFEFGDQDGTRSHARLQMPCGLALDPRSPLLWIADSGNNALKMLRLGAGDVRRLDLDYLLHEPAALAAGEGVLWVANSAAHEVLRVELESGAVRRLPVGE